MPAALGVNGSAQKTAARSEVGTDHQRSPVEAVEQGPERQPDDDRRQELDDEHRTDPDAGVARPVLDVDRQRDRGEQRADARAERRQEQKAEAGEPQRCQLAGDGGAEQSAGG